MDETLVQFHKDQVKLLVVRESQLAIYDAEMLTRLCQVGIIFGQNANYPLEHFFVLVSYTQLAQPNSDAISVRIA